MKIHISKAILFFCILQLFAFSSCSDDDDLGYEPTQTGTSYGNLGPNDFVATGDVKDIHTLRVRPCAR